MRSPFLNHPLAFLALVFLTILASEAREQTVLSDEGSRRRYDRTGQHQEQGKAQQQQQRYSGWNTWPRYRRQRLKDKFEVKEAQSRILHIVSLEQLETVIVDEDTGKLERNLLMVFYTPPLEEHLMDEMVYPWPFAAKSSQGIWWEDLLQTTSIRFHRSSKVSEFFHITNGDTMDAPIFVFGKRGQALEDSPESWPRLATRSRDEFDRWVWQQIQVQVEFVNDHDHDVEIYWINGRKASLKDTLQPGKSRVHTTMLSHEWWVRDARVDTRKDSPGRYKLTDATRLMQWKITSDEHLQKLVIPFSTCYDLSGHCGYWFRHNECEKNPQFMNEQCRKTCEFCKEQESNETDAEDDDHDEL